jgi:hypothetical protein
MSQGSAAMKTFKQPWKLSMAGGMKFAHQGGGKCHLGRACNPQLVASGQEDFE